MGSKTPLKPFQPPCTVAHPQSELPFAEKTVSSLQRNNFSIYCLLGSFKGPMLRRKVSPLAASRMHTLLAEVMSHVVFRPGLTLCQRYRERSLAPSECHSSGACQTSFFPSLPGRRRRHLECSVVFHRCCFTAFCAHQEPDELPVLFSWIEKPFPPLTGGSGRGRGVEWGEMLETKLSLSRESKQESQPRSRVSLWREKKKEEEAFREGDSSEDSC